LVVSESGFSEELEGFIATEIKSVEQLEILFLLSGTPHKWWTAKAVYEVIKSSLASVKDRLEEMVRRGLVKQESGNEPTFQFAPNNEGVWSIVAELRDAYKERSVKVVQAIYSKPAAPDGVQEFARAFRLRKDK
jgi:hypothetical protein